ncbi:hypothetical protein [Leptospira noguchii]|uniref:Uncharacterized protein n=1 Tax=Leptospira noguchii TaxID=28182 RepID=A0AAE9K842_9LEPT|nr:hypothetical protein [Leptospira noguchii]UOG55531.1 hypothetical protein MAL03_11490 [Leptospira noguchii]
MWELLQVRDIADQSLRIVGTLTKFEFYDQSLELWELLRILKIRLKNLE